MLNQVRSGHSHVTSQLVFFPAHPIPGGMQSRSIGMPSRKDGPPSIWDTHGISGNVFCKSSRVLFSTLSAGIESMEFRHIRTNSLINGRRMRIKHHFKIRDASPDRQPKIQSSLVRETLQRNMGQTNNDCRVSDLHFDKFTTPATFACWKRRLKTEVCTCSQFPTEGL